MVVKPDLPPLPPFDPLTEPSLLSQRWKAWTKRFQTYLAAMNIVDDKQKRALLLYQAGQETQEIFETMSDTGDDYATAQKKLDDYFAPKKNVNFEVFQFRQAVQQNGEIVDQFATRLRKIAANCEFHNVDKELKSAIIQNCQSKRLRRYTLREEALTLEMLIKKARSLEDSKRQATGMEQSLHDESTEVVQNVRSKNAKSFRTQNLTTKCRQCGLTWPHKTGPCPAKGQSCHKCGKPNHFARMCLSKMGAKQQQQSIETRRNKTAIHQVSAPQNDPSPFEIVRIKGTMVTARQKNKYLTRNSSHFKVIDCSLEGADDSSDEEEIEEVTTPSATSQGEPLEPQNPNPNPNPPRRYPLQIKPPPGVLETMYMISNFDKQLRYIIII